MKIRTAGPQDLERVCRIHAASWKTAYRGILPDGFLDALSYHRWDGLEQMMADGLTVRVIESDENIFGCITFGAARDKDFSSWGEIVSFHLLQEARGKGFGRLLFQDGVRELGKYGYQKIYLWVLEENERARRFYEKNGFAWNGDRLESEEGGRQVTDLRYVFHFQE